LTEEPRSKAPFVVFGGMLLIALVTVLTVVVVHCQREEPYLDPEEIAPGQPGRVYPHIDPPVAPPGAKGPATTPEPDSRR
jgi:hypothetical protein